MVELDVYDAFSHSSNPNGDWQWGYAATGSAATLTLLTSYLAVSSDIAAWWSPVFGSAGASVTMPQNSASGSRSYGTVTWPATSISLHPGPGGEHAILRWTAPFAAECVVDLTFQTNDRPSTEVAVYHEGTVVGSVGYLSGATTVIGVVETFYVNTGKVLNISVGPYGSFYYDTTGIHGGLVCTLD